MFELMIRALLFMLRKRSPEFYTVDIGYELDNVKKLAKELKTDYVIFYSQRPLGDMPKLYRIAFAMLVKKAIFISFLCNNPDVMAFLCVLSKY